MRYSPILASLLALLSPILSGCQKSEAKTHETAHHKIVVTSPIVQDIVVTKQYVCQIHSRRHIEVRALEGGYLDEIPIKEGQAVRKGDLMFQIVPTIYKAKLDSETAEAQQEQIAFNNTKTLFEKKIVSQQELALAQAKVAKAKAHVELASAELSFTQLRAPFDGIIDRLRTQQGSLISEGDILTTMSDNAVMWVYFNVPEARYLEYKADLAQNESQQGNQSHDEQDSDDLQIELVLANGTRFPHTGQIGAIEADFNNETGNIAFRADFPNADGLLRHGQTGTVLINRVLKKAIVIPQRATFEILAQRYAYVVEEDGVVHQRDIKVKNNGLDDIFVIEEGLSANDKIVLEGIGQFHDGEIVEFDFRAAEEVLGHLKYKAE